MKKWFWPVLAVVLLCGVVGYWYANHTQGESGNLLTVDTPSTLIALGRLAGLLAVLALLFQVLMVIRAPWIESSYGMDRLARWHHVQGGLILALLGAHVGLLTAGNAQLAEQGYWEQYTQFLSEWDDVFPAFIAVCLLAGLGLLSLKVFRRMLGYTGWHLSHLLMYAAIFLAIEHQSELGFDLDDHDVFEKFWAGLYIGAGLLALWFRVLFPMLRWFRHDYRVAAVYPETSDVTSVRIGGRGMERLRIKPGQFVLVRFLARGFWAQEHPFSVSAPYDGNEIRLSIKSFGKYTRRIPQLPVGARVVVDGPHGAFTTDLCQHNKALLIAGGIGVTPLRSMAEPLLAEGKEITLLYANRTEAGIVFREELDALAARFPKFTVKYILSDDPAWTGEQGKITRDVISRLAPDATERDVFLCGPPPMMAEIRAALAALGVPRRQIHDERFAF